MKHQHQELVYFALFYNLRFSSEAACLPCTCFLLKHKWIALQPRWPAGKDSFLISSIICKWLLLSLDWCQYHNHDHNENDHSDFKRFKVSRNDQERWWGSKSFRGSDISTSGSSRRGRRRRRKVWEEPRLRAGRDPPSASRLQHEVQLGHLLQGEVLGVKSPQSIRFDEASLFIRGQDSVKDNLLRFIQWSWNTPSYCY